MCNPALLPDRAVIRISGPDADSFLSNLITQTLPQSDGEARFGALLTPQGKILFDFFMVKSGDAFLFDVWTEAADDFVKRMKLYRLRAKVEIEKDDALSAGTGASPSGGLTYDDPRGAFGQRFIAASDHAAQLPQDKAYDTRMIAAGAPQFGREFGPDAMFLLDVNYDGLNGVSYKKGCFVGQEVTSRMKRKGEVRRRTLIAEFDGAPLATGASVTAGDSTIGEVLSSAGNRALALIRLDRWEKAKEAGAPAICDERTLRLNIPGYLKQG